MRAHLNLGDSTQLLLEPTENDLRAHFLPHVVERLLAHLDSETGDTAKSFEVQCVALANVLWTPFDIHAVYRTRRRVGETEEVKDGIQFMITRHFVEVMRALVVTKDGLVVMQREHRRLLGMWVNMHCAGGTKKSDRLKTLISEMISETGCRPTPDSRVWRLRKSASDDGVQGEPLLNYLAVDRVTLPPEGRHVNVEDSIQGIILVPFNEWRERALDGEYDDPFSENFAARCTWNEETGHVTVRGKTELLHGPTKE